MPLDLRAQALLRSLLLTTSLWIFALFIQCSFPLKGLAILGLLLSAYWISAVLRQNPDVYLSKSLWAWRTSLWPAMLLSLSAALLLAMGYRLSAGMSWIPSHVGPFAAVSVLIGSCEEIIFRGFLQGQAERWHPKGALVLSAASHAGYKSMLFVLSLQPIDMSIQNLFMWTFVAGLALGFTRYRTGSLLPCIIAHGFFDFWVYGELSAAPWWVW